MAAEPNAMSNAQARRTADKILGRKNAIDFDWEKCRVREGYYQLRKPVSWLCIFPVPLAVWALCTVLGQHGFVFHGKWCKNVLIRH
jgi:hypothetical protein